jgi:hypothetical protein
LIEHLVDSKRNLETVLARTSAHPLFRKFSKPIPNNTSSQHSSEIAHRIADQSGPLPMRALSDKSLTAAAKSAAVR